MKKYIPKPYHIWFGKTLEWIQLYYKSTIVNTDI